MVDVSPSSPSFIELQFSRGFIFSPALSAAELSITLALELLFGEARWALRADTHSLRIVDYGLIGGVAESGSYKSIEWRDN